MLYYFWLGADAEIYHYLDSLDEGAYGDLQC